MFDSSNRTKGTFEPNFPRNHFRHHAGRNCPGENHFKVPYWSGVI